MIQFTMSIRTVSEANSREHWAKKMNRVKRQRTAARLATMQAMRGQTADTMPGKITVYLCRVGKRKLDSDNLAGSFKAIRDGIADALKIDDGDERIEWHYRQERGEYGVRVSVEHARISHS